MVKQLLMSRRFGPLFLTQFLAALNDNFLKQSLVLLRLFKIGGATGAMFGTLAGAALIAPFFTLSAYAGELADKYDKASIPRRCISGWRRNWSIRAMRPSCLEPTRSSPPPGSRRAGS